MVKGLRGGKGFAGKGYVGKSFRWLKVLLVKVFKKKVDYEIGKTSRYHISQVFPASFCRNWVDI